MAGVKAWDPLFWQRSPLFWPVRGVAERFGGFADWPSIDDYNRLVACPVRFRAQPPRPRRRKVAVDRGALYDARITVDGWVPTRTRSWHDFLNMLVWATLPRAKVALHGRQYRAIAARIEDGSRTLPARRTRELDGLALLDEGGLLLLCEERWAGVVEEALGGGRPEAVGEVIRGGGAATVIFGHALYESFFREGPVIHAMTHVVRCEALPGGDAARVALADEGLAGALGEPGSFAQPERLWRLPLEERVLCG